MDKRYKLLLNKILSISRLVLVILLAISVLRTVLILRQSNAILLPSSAQAADDFSEAQQGSNSQSTLSDYAIIFEKSIFGYNLNRSGLVGDLIPAEEALNLALIGTVSGSPNTAIASIKDVLTNLSGLYKIGDIVNGAAIESIETHSVILHKDGQKYVLSLYKQGRQGTDSSSTINSSKNLPNTQINEIDESSMRTRLGNIETVFKTAVIEPKEIDGEVEGLKISELGDSQKIAAVLGFKDGDIIQAVNDQKLTSAQKAFQVLKKARTESKITVKYLRDGKSETLTLPLR